MRPLALSLFFVLLVFTTFLAHRTYQFALLQDTQPAAVFTNDSNVVEFQPSDATDAPADGDGNSGDDSFEVEVVGVFPDTTNSNNDDTIVLVNPAGDSGNNDPVVTVVEISSSASGGSPDNTVGSGNQNEGDTTNQNSNTDTSDENNTTIVESSSVYASLLGNQAVVASGSSGVFSGGTGDSIHIDAKKLRDSLFNRNIYQLRIPNSDALLRGGMRTAFSKEDFALFVSSALLYDENLQDVDYEDGTLKTHYRALGRLFGFVPVHYTLRVSVEITSGTIQSVQVKFPWYKFFLATGVSRTGLERALSAQINEYVYTEGADLDIATRAFTGVAEILRAQFNLAS